MSKSIQCISLEITYVQLFMMTLLPSDGVGGVQLGCPTKTFLHCVQMQICSNDLKKKTYLRALSNDSRNSLGSLLK